MLFQCCLSANKIVAFPLVVLIVLLVLFVSSYPSRRGGVLGLTWENALPQNATAAHMQSVSTNSTTYTAWGLSSKPGGVHGG